MLGLKGSSEVARWLDSKSIPRRVSRAREIEVEEAHRLNGGHSEGSCHGCYWLFLYSIGSRDQLERQLVTLGRRKSTEVALQACPGSGEG